MLDHHHTICLTLAESIIHHMPETEMLRHLDDTSPGPDRVTLGLSDLDPQPLEEGVVGVHHFTGHHTLLGPELPTLDPVREDEKGAGAEILDQAEGGNYLVNQFCGGMAHNRRGH